MNPSSFRFAEIAFENHPTSDRIVGVFRFENGRKEKTTSTELVVAEMESGFYAYEQLLDTVTETVEKTRTLLADMTLDPLARFEKLISRINESVAEFQAKEPTPIHWNKINLFVLSCGKDQLCISGCGKLTNYFLKKTDKTYNVFDLCRSLEMPDPIDPKKPFASVMCGEMNPGDAFFIGTNNLERLEESLQLKKRLTELPAISALLEVEQELKTLRPMEDIAGIALTLQKNKTMEGPKKKEGAQSSLENLKKNETEATRTLAPTINPLKALKQQSQTAATPKIPKPVTRIEKIRHAILGIFRKKTRVPVESKTGLRSMHAGEGRFLNRKRKILITIFGILLCVSVAGTVAWRYQSNIKKEQDQWRTDISRIEESLAQAENDLLYQKDKSAQEQLETSETILSGLDRTDPDRITQIEQLTKRISDLRDRARKIVHADGVIELYALEDHIPEGRIAAPVLIKDAAYVADNSEKQIIKINPKTRETTKIPLPETAERIIDGALGEKSVVFLDSDGYFYAVSIQNDTVVRLNSFSGAKSIVSMALYSKRAYVLDAGSGQIFRLNQTDSGFGNMTTYFSPALPQLIDAVDFAIDSMVYVAKPNGIVNRYLRGQQEGFGLSSVNPPLRAISSIWTDAEDRRLILTDPAEKRILIFDKNGILLSQIYNETFGTLRSASSYINHTHMLIVSDNRLIYVPIQ